MSRAMMSTGPAGGKATDMRIGLDGYACPNATDENRMALSASSFLSFISLPPR
jgi:hypothetical protein